MFKSHSDTARAGPLLYLAIEELAARKILLQPPAAPSRAKDTEVVAAGTWAERVIIMSSSKSRPARPRQCPSRHAQAVCSLVVSIAEIPDLAATGQVWGTGAFRRAVEHHH
jgi:hypothetical protein